MKLKQFAEYINQALENAEGLDVEIEFWDDDTNSQFTIDSVNQFSVVPDVVIHLKWSII